MRFDDVAFHGFLHGALWKRHLKQKSRLLTNRQMTYESQNNPASQNISYPRPLTRALLAQVIDRLKRTTGNKNGRRVSSTLAG
jgi:hypothetical protein